MPLRRRYVLFLCPDCGDQYQFMGWCEACGTRLASIPVIPEGTVHEFSERSAALFRGFLVEHYVERLLEFTKQSSG